MSSKRRLRRKACSGKVAHSTEAAAVAASKALYRKTGEFVQAYRCKYSGKHPHWHVGHWKGGAKW